MSSIPGRVALSASPGAACMPGSPRPTGRPGLAACLLVAWLAVGAAAAGAATVAQSYQGMFQTDDEIFFLSIDGLGSGDVLALRTWQWAGGVNAAGETIAEGGFAPIVSLFSWQTGELMLLAQGSAGTCSAPVDSVSGFCWDVIASAALPEGDYLLALSQDGNLPGPMLFDDFSMKGNYTAAWAPPSDPDPRFYDVTGVRRAGHWALDVSISTRDTSVPLPGTWALLIAALGAFASPRAASIVRRTDGGAR